MIATLRHSQDIPVGLADAEDALARFDERLATSPIRAGWISRTHHLDACASLWLEGDLVPLEDLVLHDAAADIRTPTHEITRAHATLRARRRVVAAAPGWAMTSSACETLLGRASALPSEPTPPVDPISEEEAAFAAELAAIDALLARTSRAIAEPIFTPTATPQTRCFDVWREAVTQHSSASPVLAAAQALMAWQDAKPFDNAEWLGRILAADILRLRRKTRMHLCAISMGLKTVARQHRQSRDRTIRLESIVKGIAAAADVGMRDHDRWLAARRTLEMKLKSRRSTSHLPSVVEMVMARPLITTAMVSKELKIAPRSAQDLIAELGLRELTGRRHYRAWGIL